MINNCGYEIVAFQRIMQNPSEQQSEMKAMIGRLATIPGVVEIEEFLAVQYIFKIRPV